MASLKDLLNNRTSEIDSVENNKSLASSIAGDNVEYFVTAGSHSANTSRCVDGCWAAPTAGKAIIEVWGGGGGSGINCCCSWGIPGNAGGYIKTEVCLDANENIHYVVRPGGCAYTHCCGRRGCQSCFCIVNKACGYADGGWEGRGVCNNSNPNWCCALSTGIAECVCRIDTACGLMRNPCAEVSGVVTGSGAFNTRIIPGPRGCVYSCCCHETAGMCCATWHIPYPGGVKGVCGGTVGVHMQGSCHQNSNHRFALQSALAFNMGGVQSSRSECWQSWSDCACYETGQCHGMLGIGTGSTSSMAHDSGPAVPQQGGPGAIRITFIPS